MVVLPVFVQAPWVHVHPYSALLFTIVLLSVGIICLQFFPDKFLLVGSLLLGVSASWFGGCLFWGWLRANPIWHLPVESIALPIACLGLNARWRIGAGFYLASLLGTALTDFMIVVTGVMKSWPTIANASLKEASKLLNETALSLINIQAISLLLIAVLLIIFLAYLMNKRARLNTPFSSTWLVASAAISTTLWVDGLFFLTTLIQPKFSGLI